WNGYHVPFLYSTNGELIYFIDVRDEQSLSRQIANFHTADALEEFFTADQASGVTWLQTNPNNIERLRYYQKDAISSVESAMVQGKRNMLIAMATGTGKTYTTVAQIYRLLESKTAKRILFLVDRRVLAAQAVSAFAAFNTPKGNKFTQEYDVFSQRFHREDFDDDKPYDPKVLPGSYLTTPKPAHTFIYVSTIQRMCVNLFGWESAFPQNGGDPDDESDAEKLDIPIHAFDVIIADECHRGYTSRDTAIWRRVLDYFDSIKIGLTATPASHTIAYFRDVVYRYTTEQAVLDGFLVDYDAIRINSNVRMNGAFLKEGEQVGIVDTGTGKVIYDALEDEREFGSEDIEQKITSPESNRKIITEIADYARKHEETTGRFPKTLIFAVNDLPFTSHADQLVQICRAVFGKGDDFVQKITGSKSVDRPLQKIREFRNRPNPKVVVSVDMLTTGVDIPSLEFIVFLRPVKSRILWVQMLGRGTRPCPGINKTHFAIFDCFNGTLIEYFKNTTDFDVSLQKEAVALSQVIENIYQNIDREYHIKVLVKRLRRIEKDMSGEAREKFSAYIPDGDMGRFASELPDKIEKDFTNIMKLLRDKDFQNLLQNYPRPQRSFLIGYDVKDVVTSEVMIRRGAEYQKPEDYLVAFSRFVKENPEHIEAIRILLERPKDWKTAVLNELVEKLKQNKFPPDDLEKAHKYVYKKPLVDIISMVKHAAKEQEPMLTADERVGRAMQKVTSGKSFNEDQKKWLGLIRDHLVKNLTIGEDDLDYAPIFERNGGLGRARRVFDKELGSLLAEINAGVAA
ncbi:MAG TPA: type I restriction-modification enzyme R subunit C-terminal domain-containing protein, partial [Anaerolineales bacterium]|nr:type I restriction-modification enzyme R subunit C-terminal domain-containing protein [Anaerolineales bacterium]